MTKKYCTTRAEALAEMQEWLKTAPGVLYNGNWGAQCARLTQRYSEIIFGGSYANHHGYGNAINVIDGASRAYFDVYWYQVGFKPEPGDITVWRGKPGLWGSNQLFGHIGVVESATSSSVTVLNQDGAAPPVKRFPDGFYYSQRGAYRSTFRYVNDPGCGNIRGWLRPKTSKVLFSNAIGRGYGPKQTTPQNTQTKTKQDDWSFGMDKKEFIQTIKDTVGSELRHHTKPGNRESKQFLDGMSWAIRGSINHMLSPSTEEGKRILERIANAVLDAPVLLEGIDGDGKKTTNLKTKIAWQSELFKEIRRDISALKEENAVLAEALNKILDEREGEAA